MTNIEKIKLTLKGLETKVNLNEKGYYDYPDIRFDYVDLRNDPDLISVGIEPSQSVVVCDFRKEKDFMVGNYEFKTLKDFWQIVENLERQWGVE